MSIENYHFPPPTQGNFKRFVKKFLRIVFLYFLVHTRDRMNASELIPMFIYIYVAVVVNGIFLLLKYCLWYEYSLSKIKLQVFLFSLQEKYFPACVTKFDALTMRIWSNQRKKLIYLKKLLDPKRKSCNLYECVKTDQA